MEIHDLKSIITKDGDKKRLSGAQKRKFKKANAEKDNPIEKTNVDIVDNIKYLVVPVEYPEKKLFDGQFEQLKLAISQHYPGSCNVSKYKGGLKINCNNLFTYNQLSDLVIEKKSLLSIKLKIIDFKDVPVYQKIMFSIRNLLEDPDMILKKLETGNENLVVKNWRLIHKEMNENSQRFVYSIDEQSIKNLEVRGFQLVFDNQKIKIILLDRKKR